MIPNILVDNIVLPNKPLSNLEIIDAVKKLSMDGFRGVFLRDTLRKNYVDKNAITTAGGVVSCDILLKVGSDSVRRLGCSDLRKGNKFTLVLGTDANTLSFSIPNQLALLPVKLDTMGDFCHIDFQ